MRPKPQAPSSPSAALAWAAGVCGTRCSGGRSSFRGLPHIAADVADRRRSGRTAAAVTAARCPRSGVSAVRGGPGAAGVRKARPVSAPVGRWCPSCADLARLTKQLSGPCFFRMRAGTAAAGAQPGAVFRAVPRGWPVRGGVWCPRCGQTLRSCGPADTPQPAGWPAYRKVSPGRRPLVGCSHRRQVRQTCRARR